MVYRRAVGPVHFVRGHLPVNGLYHAYLSVRKE